MLKVGRKRKRKELRKKERQRAHKLDLSSRFSASHQRNLLFSFIRRMFCVFPESFSLHLGSMGVDAYAGLFYIYW